MSMTGLMMVSPRVLSPSSTVMDAARLMNEHELGAVAIEGEGKLCGVFTYRDLVERVVLPKRSPEETALADVMTKPVDSLTKDATCSEALRMMMTNDYTYVPIVDEDGHVTGLVSLRGLLQHGIDDLARELDSMSKYYAVDGPGG